MLAWKSWKRGPEGQPLLPTFRVQTIAICLVAAGVMQRAPSAIRPVLPVKVINKRLVSVFLFLAPSSLFLSLSLAPPTPFVFCRRADRFGTRWRTAKTRSTFIPPNLWTFEKFFSTLEFTAGLETRAAGGGIIIVGCVHADAKLCKFLTPRRDEWSGGGGSLKKNSRDSEFCFIFPFFFIRFLIVLGGRRSRRFCSSRRFFSFFYFHQFFETRIVRIFR